MLLVPWTQACALSCRDCVVYSAFCHTLDGRRVAVKVYEKSKLSTSKLRAVKREAAMMIYMTRKRYTLLAKWPLHLALYFLAIQDSPLGVSSFTWA